MAAVLKAISGSGEVRHRVRVRGQVQGVGFRPFVYRLAGDLGLRGWVRNDGEGVEIEVLGAPEAVAGLVERLPREAPPLARVTAVETREQPLELHDEGFRIVASGSGAMSAEAAPDTGVCDDCLAELFDPADRRHRYPFINCTQCGPRYTLIRGLPYDRPQTSMAAFAQCPSCLGEYEAPADRRFHAEPNACPVCGPGLWLVSAEQIGAGDSAALTPDPSPGARGELGGAAREMGVDVIADAVARLRGGEILAIKGLGGFHLACDARNADAVARLRQRKNREEKPFAVMVANAASAGEFAAVDEASLAALESVQRPIVLLRKGPSCDDRLRGVAPGLAWLGVMLPYTPLHHLLFHEAAGRPAGTDWLSEAQPLTLVMTSANPGGEPLVIGNDEALRRLHGIADAFVMHDREIVTRCDDSVVRSGEKEGAAAASAAGSEPAARASSLQFIRRARGYTPQAIALAREGPAVLACGGYLKNTVCFSRGAQAFVSQHIGDLDNAATCAALEETVGRLLELLRVEPQVVAHDLHPDFHSSRFAAEFARVRGLPLVPVQHHHAHVAAVMAEHGLEGEVLGLALDGVGLGTDGGVWGGELLRASARHFVRLGHLRELPLPGGDKAAREPWRMAASALHLLGRGGEIKTRFAYPAAKALPLMLKSGVHTPPTSSCGRWFDAAAGLAGIKDMAAFEGQAAMLYEGLAERHGTVAPLPVGHSIGASGELDLLPLLARLADEADASFGAALFHATLATALADWVEWAAQREGLRRVALGGGCFLNRVLSRELRALLEARGFEVFEANQVPPNDGGLSLGQAWIAAQRFIHEEI